MQTKTFHNNETTMLGLLLKRGAHVETGLGFFFHSRLLLSSQVRPNGPRQMATPISLGLLLARGDSKTIHGLFSIVKVLPDSSCIGLPVLNYNLPRNQNLKVLDLDLWVKPDGTLAGRS